MNELDFISELKNLFTKYNIEVCIGENMTADQLGKFHSCGSSIILKAPSFEVDLVDGVNSGWFEGVIE